MQKKNKMEDKCWIMFVI